MWLIWSGVAILLLAMAASTAYHLQWAQRLPSVRSLAAIPLTPSLCSVIIAARDESLRIERILRSLLALEGVQIEVLVVDDRSTDGTTEIVRGIAIIGNRVRVLRIDELPPDWLGKCHACHLGATDATGDWLLFTDADCWLKPDVLARALRVALEQSADHIVLTPGITARSCGARAWHVAFLMSLSNWFSGVNRDRPGAYLGMGAFNLVRTEAYRRSGVRRFAADGPGRCGTRHAHRPCRLSDSRIHRRRRCGVQLGFDRSRDDPHHEEELLCCD